MSREQHAGAERTERESVELPPELVSRIESRLPRTDFETPGEYVTFAMEEVLAAVEAETEDDDYEGAVKQEVETRLESLGYLDG